MNCVHQARCPHIPMAGSCPWAGFLWAQTSFPWGALARSQLLPTLCSSREEKNWAVRCLSLWWSKRWQAGRAWLGMGTPNLDINRTADKSSVALYSVNPYIRSLENIMQPVSPTGPWVSLESKKSFLVSFYKTGLYHRMRAFSDRSHKSRAWNQGLSPQV